MESRAREIGQASVELVAVLPVLLLLVLAAIQMAIVGYGLWAGAGAARACARAAYIGGDPQAAARSAVPKALRPDARVEGAGPVAVALRVPSLIPNVDAIPVTARAGLGPGDAKDG